MVLLQCFCQPINPFILTALKRSQKVMCFGTLVTLTEDRDQQISEKTSFGLSGLEIGLLVILIQKIQGFRTDFLS